MKTLLISTCNHGLSNREFVLPISEILGKNEHDIIYFEGHRLLAEANDLKRPLDIVEKELGFEEGVDLY